MIITTFIFATFAGLLLFNLFIHLQISLRSNFAKHEMAFTVTVFAAICYVLLTYMEYMAQTEAQYFSLLRIQILFIPLFQISLILFTYFLRSKKPGKPAYIYFTLVTLFNLTRFFLPNTGLYTTTTGMVPQLLPWNETIYLISGESSFLVYIYAILLICPIPYYIFFSIRQLKEGNKRQGILMLIAFLLHFLGVVFDFVIAFTGLNWLYTSEAAFVFMTVVLSFSLTDEVIKLSKLQQELARAMKEKNILIQELNHRVKNNMILLFSLIDLQQNETDSTEAKKSLEVAKNRIMSLIIAEKTLFRSTNLERLDLSIFLVSLINQIASEENIRDRISFSEELTPLQIDISKTLPCALLLHEILSHTITSLFPGEQQGSIKITLTTQNNQPRLSIRTEYLIDENTPGEESGLQFSEIFLTEIMNLLITQLNARSQFTSPRVLDIFF